MLRMIEKLRIKMLGNTEGYSFNMMDWYPEELADKILVGEQLTKAEAHAKAFLEQVGYTTMLWDIAKMEEEDRKRKEAEEKNG